MRRSPVRRRPASRLLLAVFVAVLSVIAALVSPAVAVGEASTSTTLTVTPADPVFGDDITLRAEVVTGEVPVAVTSGTVEFAAVVVPLGFPGGPPDPVVLGQDPVDADGVAEIVVSADSIGVPTLGEGQVFIVTATYLGVENEFFPSPSDPISVTPTLSPGDPDPTATTTTVSGPDSATVGVEVDLTASVSPDVAEGTVQFAVDGELVGDPVEVVEGAAALPHTFSTAGEQTVTAEFVPTDEAAFGGSTDSVGRQVTVTEPDPDPIETTTTVSGPDSATVGVEVDLTASVSPDVAEGTVQFAVDGELVGDPVEVVEGAAALPHTFSTAGEQTVTAEFVPTDEAAFGGSTDSVGRQVTVTEPDPDPTATTTTVTGPATAVAGTPTTLTASVSPELASGSVQFAVGGTDVGDPITVVDGLASLPHTFATSGNKNVGATFTPDEPGDYGSSTGSAVVSVSHPPSLPPDTTTTTVTGPASPSVGTPSTFTASVTPAGAPGTVQFSVDDHPIGEGVPVSSGQALLVHTFTTGGDHFVGATFTPTNAAVYAASAGGQAVTVPPRVPIMTFRRPKEWTVGSTKDLLVTFEPVEAAGSVQFTVDGSPIDSPVPVTEGFAFVEHTFTTGGEHTMRASFEPENATNYAASSASLTVTPHAMATFINVSVAVNAPAGEESTLTANGLPAEAAGTVTFLVGGAAVTTTEVVAGTATTRYRFGSSGDHTVAAIFDPNDDATYQSSSKSRTFHVKPGVNAYLLPTNLFVVGKLVPNNIRSSAGSRTGATCWDNVHANLDVTRIQSGASIVEVDRPDRLGSASDSLVYPMEIDYVATTCELRASAAQPIRGTVLCLPTGEEYRCPLYLEAVSSLRLKFSVPVSAALAGQRVKLKPSVSYVDSESGEPHTMKGATQTVRVPRRTVLSARLAPVKRGLSSVQRGRSVAYRVVVGNEGIVTADHVRTCVTVGKGAEIQTARHASIRGRRACWFLPSLGKRESAARTLVVTAPQKAGDLAVTARVRPKKSQASRMRLRTVLPVR